MNHNKEIIEVFEAVLFALVCPFTFLLDDTIENKDKEETDYLKEQKGKKKDDENNKERGRERLPVL